MARATRRAKSCGLNRDGDAARHGNALGASGVGQRVQSPVSPSPPHPLIETEERESGRVGETILRRFLRASGPVTRDDILNRYAFPETWLDEMLANLVASRDLVKGHFSTLFSLKNLDKNEIWVNWGHKSTPDYPRTCR